MVRPVYDATGTLQGFVKIMRDLTEEKKSESDLIQSEERLRITLESAVDYAIITTDIKGKVTSWSRGAELIFGYTESEILGQQGSLIFTQADRNNGVPEKEMQVALQNGRALDERWHQRKDGSVFFMSGVMTPINSNGELIGFVKVARDLTDRRLIEQQKDEFIGIASHELKTPITSLKIFTEILQERFRGKNDLDSFKLMEKINVQIDRLTGLISDLLDTTKVAEGKLPLELETFDINALVTEKKEELQLTSKVHQLVIKSGATQPVTADRERIGQVIVNLISNAIKYSPQPGDIIIETRSNNNHVTVSVKDHGIGISPTILPKVFDRFFRADGIVMQTYPGMGLGLYICAGIIQRHGGTIDVKSEEGKGSTFYFTLPVHAKN